ncbi:hypothetical protein LTR10_000492 [Elasticomyces elasticus]|nr:hypothetical protein LTR10_000492 [Elasticomyces elasticus]KAK4980259.1 hypothetical protein LTR42_000566 [Elasticomyces elasticus]
MSPPVYTEAEWATWFDTNPQVEEQGDAPLSGEMRSTLLPSRESTPRYEDRSVPSTEPHTGPERVEFNAHLRAGGPGDAPLVGEMRSTSRRPRESTPRYWDRRMFTIESQIDATTSAYDDMTALRPTRPLQAEGQGGATLSGAMRGTALIPRENRARREERPAPPPRPLRPERQGDDPLRGERRSTPRRPRESTPRYEDRPVPSTERDIAAGNPAYDMMAAPQPRFRNEAELAKLAEYEAYIRAEAQRNAALWGEMRSTTQRPREKRVRREEQPVQLAEWNLAAGRFEYGAGTFPHSEMMAASPPWPRSEGSGGPMTMPPPQWQADFASPRPQRPRRDMAHEYPLDFSPTMSPPPPPGTAIRHPPGEPRATFASTLPQRPEPGIARGYHSGVAPTMPQPPAFGMAGGHAPASFTEHSAFGQPGPYQDMPGDPSPDDWVFMGFSGNPKMMMEANAFAMLSPQDLASAPAAQAPRSRGPYAESHHPYQPHSGFPLQMDHQSGGGQSYFQGVRVMPNTEAPQPSPYAAPYGHIQPTQLPMDPQQMYHAPSISAVANTIPTQASVYAAPYIHIRRTQSHVDPQQMYQAPSIPPVTNNYNFGIMVQGNQRNSSGNNGMQLHAAPPSAAPLPANHIDNTAAKRSKSAGPPLKETNIYQWDPKCLKNPTKHPTNMCNEENSHKSAGVIHVDVSLFPSGIDIPDKDKAKKKKYRRKKES